MVRNFRCNSTGHAAVHSKHRKFTHHPDDQFDQYTMFVLGISIFEMTALSSCTSNTMLDINRPINWSRTIVLNFCCHSTDLMISPQAAKTYTSWSLLWSIYVGFSEYRHLPWRHWSLVDRILCRIKISLKMVEKDGLEFPLLQHWSCSSSPQQAPKFYASWWRILSILTKHSLLQLFLKYNLHKFSTKWMSMRRTVCASFLNEGKSSCWNERNKISHSW